MINRKDGKIIWECDDCGEQLESDTADFSEAMEIFREEDWQAINLGRGFWSHHCSNCAED